MRFSFANYFHINFLKTVRGRLIFGLLPGLVALITLLAIGLLATDILVRANAHLAESGRELAITRSMQPRLHQIIISLMDAVENKKTDSREQYLQQANDLDQIFLEAQPLYGETAEQVLSVEVLEQWQLLRVNADHLLTASDQENTDQLAQEVIVQSETLFQRLEALSDAVFDEMQKTVAAGRTAHDTASALLISSTFIAFLLGLVFVWLFPDYITRPIVALREGAAKIGSGDLNYRLQIERQDEVGELAREFNLMAARLRDSYQHLEDRVAERTAQLWALNEASRSVVGDLRIERVLQTIADLALTLGDAAYAAVLVPRRQDDAAPRFIVAPATLAANPLKLPESVGQGLLDLLLKTDRPLRTEDLQRQPQTTGLPERHPAMQNFLGIPIRVHGRTIGGLYLTNKRNGARFTEEDEQILSMLAAYAGIAIENARLYQELTQMNEELELRVQERTAELEAVSAERAEYAATLRQVLNRTVQIQEEERRRIAQDIHDGVSQWLMGALFELQAARVRLPETAVDIQQHLAEAQRVLKEVKDEMRRVIYDLHPPLLESNGLVTAMRNQVQELETHSRLQVQFLVEGDAVRLPLEQELALFRIGQEALNNVVKHADSRAASVRLRFSEDEVRLCVIDDGVGFDHGVRQVAVRAQLGLLSMSERAAAVGAALEITSSLERGTRVQVTLPYHPATALAFSSPQPDIA